MTMQPPDTSAKRSRVRRGRGLILLLSIVVLIWSLPHPTRQDVVVDSKEQAPQARISFRTAELVEGLAGKGMLADETELSGPAFADDDKTLYFSRARPGQRADIVRSTWDGEQWSRPQAVRELNSVDDDRRLTLSSDRQIAALASNRSGGRGGFDIYDVQAEDGHWSHPRNAGSLINSEANEFDPALSPDGLTLYFVRMLPSGDSDVFVARRETVGSNWSTPQPVEAINLAGRHERSPAVSPDNRFLYFASNRGRTDVERTAFGLFRVRLQDDHVAGPVERITDGMESSFDDVDAAFSASGRSLVFASKRDGPKQLYLARGDFVVTRLTLSTAHLDRFGRGKWGVPLAAAVLCGIAYGWTRRISSEKHAEKRAAVSSAKDSRQPTPTKNPLANWRAAPPLDIQQSGNAKVRSAAVLPETKPATSQKPDAAARSKYSLGHLTAVVATIFVIASLGIALRKSAWNNLHRTTADSLSVETLSATFSFAELSDPKRVELSKLPRVDTSPIEVAEPVPLPSAATALRTAALWPGDRIVVRQRFQIGQAITSDIKLDATKRSPVLTRRSLTSQPSSIAELRADEHMLSPIPSTAEKPISILATTLSRQPPATSSYQLLFRPAEEHQSRLSPSKLGTADFLVATPLAVGVSAPPMPLPVPRKIAGLTGNPVNCPPLETLLSASATSIEVIVSPRLKPLPRTEERSFLQPISISNTATLLRVPARWDIASIRALPIEFPTVSRTPGLTSKGPTQLNAIPLNEDVASPEINASPIETSVSFLNTKLARTEVEGPHHQISTIPLTSIDRVILRGPSQIELATNPAIESATNTAQGSIMLTRRSAIFARTAEASPEARIGTEADGSAISLVSAEMLVETAAFSTLTSIPRIALHAFGPALMDSSLLRLSNWSLPLVKPLSVDAVSVENHPKSMSASPPLARRIRVLTPAELPEAQ